MPARFALAILAASALAGSAAAADMAGTWRTPAGGLVEIARCAASVCARLVTSAEIARNPSVTDGRNKNAALRGRPLKGLTLMQGFTGGPTEWKGGQIYNPEDGGTYRASLKLAQADTLEVKGCLGPMLCRTQIWRRAS
jgi:uncharacterized protein (DUF2147 family)